MRTNTIFGVVHKAGGYTAWSDKHPAYSSVSGPGDGKNVDDYYSPEINSNPVGLPGVSLPLPGNPSSWIQTGGRRNDRCVDRQLRRTSSATIRLKVQAILNEING